MMRLSLLFFMFGLMMGHSAYAYVEKTYECQNVDNLPKNTYKFQTVSVAPGVSLPYVEITRYFRTTAGDVSSPVEEIHLRGFGTVSTNGSHEVILLSAIRMEFEGDQLTNCH